MAKEELVFSTSNIPEDIVWGKYWKQVPIKAARIFGPFSVETSEGLLTCKDGWLCIDARGYPYPVADEEFQLIYGPSPQLD